MLTRLVKMTFDKDKVDEFVALMEENSHKIRAVEGCQYLQILQDQSSPNVFFTYSIWEGSFYLHQYRHSALFKEVWNHAKQGFIAKPEAWSLDKIIEHKRDVVDRTTK
ncbi:MAG: antibiotic biosynthesis monooxygenase [Chitinophagales bacterium]